MSDNTHYLTICVCGGEIVPVRVPALGGIAPELGTATEHICRKCSALYTRSGKYIPPGHYFLSGVPVQVIVFQNNAVMVFDGMGQQVPDFQFLLGQGTSREAELRRIFDPDRWEWRIWPSPAVAGHATPEWLQGRAGQLARHFGIAVPDGECRTIAEMENTDGELLIQPAYDARGRWRGFTGQDRLYPDGPPARDAPAGEDT